MIYVQVERCTGCGVCVQVCLAGAIALQRGVAVVDQAQCTECETCLEACPERAILSVSEPVTEMIGPPAERPTPEVIRVQVPSLASTPSAVTSVPWRTRVLPAVAAALAYVGRELPRLVPAVLDALERRNSQAAADERSAREQAATGSRGGSSRQRRRRRRGG